MCGQNLLGDWQLDMARWPDTEVHRAMYEELVAGGDMRPMHFYSFTETEAIFRQRVSEALAPKGSMNLVFTGESLAYSYQVLDRSEARCELTLAMTYPPPNDAYTLEQVVRLDESGLCFRYDGAEGPFWWCYERT